MTLNCVCMHVIDTSRFSSLPPVSVAPPTPPNCFPHSSTEQKETTERDGVDDHTQRPGLINKCQNRVPVFRELSYHGCNLWRAQAYKAITSGAHYFPRSVVISPYDKPGQLLWARDGYTPPIRVLELSLLVCGPC